MTDRAGGSTGPSHAPAGVWQRLGERLRPQARRPQLRPETLAWAWQRRRTADAYVVIKNRSQPAYLRLTPREFALLELMDGTRTVGDLVVEYFLRYRVLAFQRVVGLVGQLERHGFLTSEPVDVYAGLEQRLAPAGQLKGTLRRVGGWLLGRELALHGVDALVARWHAGWGRWLFARPVQWLLAGLSTLGLALFASELWRGSQRLFLVGDSYAAGLTFLLAFGVVATVLHELGHALALKHVGGEVRRAGVLLYYGMPAFFVDTTDAWMAGLRARLAVSWAGPATALVLGGLASIGASLAHGTALGDILFAWAVVSYVDVLVNLNPLLELDGYYLLVDALERPLLRRDALAFARGPLWEKLRRRASFSRDERLLALFGLASGAWTAFSIWLALYLWEARLQVVVGELLRTPGPLARLTLALLAGGAFVLVAILAIRAVQVAAPWLAGRASLLARRGESIRRRETVALLRRLPFLGEMPEARLVETAALLRPVRVRAGDTVVRQGEVGHLFFLVKRGSLTVVRDGEPVAILQPGSYFGELALLAQQPRTATVIARDTSELLAMRGDDFGFALAHELETFVRLRARAEARQELAHLPWLAGLGPTEVDLLVAKLEPHSFQPGDAVVRQGERGDHFYIVRSGRVQVESGGEPVSTLGPGEYFGEIALLMEVPRTATVRALGPAPLEVWSLNREDFTDVLGQYLGLAGDLADLGHRRLHQLGAA